MLCNLTKKDEKTAKIYYEKLIKVPYAQINEFLNKIDVNNLMVLKYHINNRKYLSTNNNIIKDEFYLVSINTNIQNRMVNQGASRE